MKNLFGSLSQNIKKALQGDGDQEIQDSFLLNFHPKVYRWIFYVFILSYLTTQFFLPNILLQIYLIAVITIVPGQAIMRIRVIDFKNSVLNLFFSIMLSLITIMFLFLIVAFSLNIVGIQKAFSSFLVGFILVATTGASLVVCSFGNSKPEIQSVPRVSHSNLRYFLLSIGIIFFSFHAVTRLNVYGTSFESIILTYMLIGGLIVILFVPGLLSNPFGLSVMIWSLTLAAFISSTWRGDGGFYGYDINLEFNVASKVIHDGFWGFGASTSPYYAMLSITILPAILAIFSKISLVVLYKTFYVAVAALIPIAMIAFLRRFVEIRLAIITVYILILGSISYFNNFAALNRQVIGTAIFFGIFVVIFQNQWSISRRKRFIIILTLGVSVSHYSTAYLFSLIALLGAFMYSATLLFDLFGIISSGRVKEAISAHQNRIFTLPFTLLLVVVIFTWNGVLTHSSENLGSVISNLTSAQNKVQLLPSKEKNAFTRYLAGNSTVPLSAEDYRTAVILKGKIENPNLQLRPESFEYNLEKSKISSIRPLLGSTFGNVMRSIIGISKIIYQLPIVISGLFFVFVFYRQRRTPSSELDLASQERENTLFGYFREKSNLLVLFDLASLTFSGILIAAVFRSTTLVSQFYNTDRAALQISILWILPFALFYDFCTRIPKIKYLIHGSFLLCAAVLLHFQLGLTALYDGTYVSKVSAINANVDTQIITTEEVESAHWISKHLNSSDTIQMDGLARVNFLKFDNPARTIANIAPFALDVDSFVFLNRANLMGNVEYDSFLFRRFVSPNDYITKYYSPVYVSDNTRLFK